MVLALQLFYILRKFGSVGLLGPGIALSLIRELGPVLCALMITGRAGSALTAEIGMMRISEQIDALTAMALNPVRYLIVPNIVGAIIVFPLLTSIFNVVGIYGGYLVGVKILGISSGTYFSLMRDYVDMEDIMIGLYKSVSFGIIVSWICCYKGFLYRIRRRRGEQINNRGGCYFLYIDSGLGLFSGLFFYIAGAGNRNVTNDSINLNT